MSLDEDDDEDDEGTPEAERDTVLETAMLTEPKHERSVTPEPVAPKRRQTARKSSSKAPRLSLTQTTVMRKASPARRTPSLEEVIEQRTDDQDEVPMNVDEPLADQGDITLAGAERVVGEYRSIGILGRRKGIILTADICRIYHSCYSHSKARG